MPTIALDFRPAHKKAEVFHRDTSKFRLICGAWRAAKSWTLMDELREMALRIASRTGAGGLIGLFRKYGPGLDDTTWGQDFRARVPDDLIVKGSDKKEKGRPECTLLGGTRVVGRSMDDWKKFGGWSFDAIFVSQAEEFTEQDFNMLRGRLSGRKGPRRMALDANPPPRSHWLYKHFGDPATRQEGYSCHHFSMLDNAHNLPEDYVAEHLKLRETNPALYKRFVLGEWGYTHEGAPVYPEFREERHVHRLQPVRGEDMFMLWGWDFGYHHPACLAPGTRVLTRDLRWLPVERLTVGQQLIAFDEESAGGSGGSRCWRPSVVTAAQPARKSCVRVTLEDGTAFVASEDHHFLVRERAHEDGRSRRNGWCRASDLRTGATLPRFFTPWESPDTYDAGWMAGFYDGEGCVYVRSDGHLKIDVSQVVNGLLDKVVASLVRDGFDLTRRSLTELRPNQQDTERVSIRGGWAENVRFLGRYRPQRLLAKHDRLFAARGPHMQQEAPVRVVAVERLGVRDVVVLETSTRTYVAEGYGHHNCVWGQLLPTGHLLVLREKMAIDTNIRLFARAAMQEHYTHFPGYRIAPLEDHRNRVRVWVDPAGKQKNDLGTTSIKEIVKEGLYPRYRKLKLVRSIYQMQQLMREDFMGVPMYRIDPQCRILIEGNGGGYHMDPDTDLPVKDGFYDHLQDAERHMAVPAMMGGAMPARTGPPPQRPRVAV